MCSYYRGYAVAGLVPAASAPRGEVLAAQGRSWPKASKLQKARLQVMVIWIFGVRVPG